MNTEQLKSDYQEIWNKYEENLFPEVLKRGFLFQFDCVQEPDVLFIGINPSFDKSKPDLRQHYKRENVLPLPYFNAFENIKITLEKDYYTNRNVTWTHLDLLVFRETNQKFVDVFIKDKELGVPFVWDQLMVAKKILEYIKPKVIVVSNTKARALLGKDRSTSKGTEVGVWMGYHFEFDTKIGTDRITTEGVLQNTPVFFTSMLSGQRAIDNGSKERLVWHIDRVLS